MSRLVTGVVASDIKVDIEVPGDAGVLDAGRDNGVVAGEGDNVEVVIGEVSGIDVFGVNVTVTVS